MVNAEILKILPHYPDGREDLSRSRANYQERCLNDRVAVDMFAAQNSETTSLSDYAGNYESNVGLAVVRNRDDGVLEVTIRNQPARILISVSDDVFTIGPGFYLLFQRSDTGMVTHVLFLEPNGITPAYRR